ncbi:MAG: hypothetical protein WC881_11910, partial [Elusimicrobiota bacterium]
MNTKTRPWVRALAGVLAYLIAAQPVCAAMQYLPVRAGSTRGAPAVSIPVLPGSAASSLSLSGTSLKLIAGSVLPAAPAPYVNRSIRAAVFGSALSATAVPALSPQALLGPRVSLAVSAAAAAVEGIEKAAPDQARAATEEQFAALTGERRAAGAADPAGPISVSQLSPRGAYSPALRPSVVQTAGPQSEVPSVYPETGKSSFFKVFSEPERNKAFWRYLSGYVVFLFGFKMYMVGLPYYISSLTKNSLREHGDTRLSNPDALNALIRENRSLARFAHWGAQFFSYATAPLFSRKAAQEGPRKWLVRSYLARGAILAMLPVLFFTSGHLALGGVAAGLCGIIALHSFFQGVSVTSESVAGKRIFGDRSVSQAERTKANSILTFVAAGMSIIGPILGGQVAAVKELFGKANPGGAVIYGIYALVCGLGGLIFSTVGLIGNKLKPGAVTAASSAEAEAAAPHSLGGVLKDLIVSFWDGLRMVLKNRLLRVLLALSLISSLFSDPLIFNVLPEYVEGLVKANPGSIGAVMKVPVLGWFLRSLTGTPMGNFALMASGASLGSILASLTIKPMRRFFMKLGFKTEEALTIPFYMMAALEAPL